MPSDSFSPEQLFQIAVPQASLDLLQQKLSLVSLPNELDVAGWNYGAPLGDVKRLVEHWKTSFDWRKCDERLNEELPQFKRTIELSRFGGIGVHYVHQRSSVADAIPLCFVHGWPGSFLEVKHILPLLINGGPDAPSFHVVALSLPNFGFSDCVTKSGFRLEEHAEVAHRLMLSLGYDEYVTQGGDWGYMITRLMAQRYGPKYVKAWHTNFPTPPRPDPLYQPLYGLEALISYFLPFTEKMRENQARLLHSQQYFLSGSGYMTIQASKPQTIGYALTDSPVGLLAWIYEKLVAWTDNYNWTDDQVLEWVSIYYFSTAGPAASLRIYYEALGGQVSLSAGLLSGPKPTIPFGCSYFPKEVMQFPKSWSSLIGNLVMESSHNKGGHFAAYEQPEALVNDLRTMFRKGDGPAFGVVSGRTGY